MTHLDLTEMLDANRRWRDSDCTEATAAYMVP